jgi:succinoglycan biosynthesis transport protein ExoP
MLQRNTQQIDATHAPLSSVVQGYSEDGFGEMMHYALALLRRRHLMIIVVFLLAMATSVAYLLLMPPTYTARVQILFNNSRAQFLQQQSLLPEPLVDASQIETQLQLIKSRATAIRVINELKLADDPDLSDPAASLSWLGRWTSSAPREPQLDAPGQPSENER